MRARRCLPLLLGALHLSACAPRGPALDGLRGRWGGTLRLAAADDLRTLDTAIAYDSASWRFIRLLGDGLLDYGGDATLQPAVARELPSITDGGRTLTFHLRDDVLFHHGRQVVAEDFKYALERLLDPASRSPAAALFANIVGARDYLEGRAAAVAGLRCPDPLTLIVELERPDLAFLNVITMPFAYPLPRELVERYTDPLTGSSDWARHAVGCGPYRLVEWTRGRRIRVERFEGYYRRDVAFLDAVTQQFCIPDFMQLMMFERGEIDVSDIPLPDFERVTSDPDLKSCLRSLAENAIFYCSMNVELPPFDNKKLRQAFNLAIDKERLCRLLNGTAIPAVGVLPPGMPGYNPRLRGYPYDPVRARRLLAEAGYPEGLEVTLTTRSRPREKVWAEAVQADLRAIGVRVTLDPVAFPKWLDLSGKRGQLPFTVNNWYQDYPDPSNFLEILLSGDHISDFNSTNRAFYANPEVDRLLRRAAAMTDVEARLKVYQMAEQLIVDDAPWIFLFHPTRYVLVQPWVKGYQLHPVWSSRDERVWLEPVEHTR